MSWYYSKNGLQLGPVPEEELLAKFKNGEVLPTDLIWKEGMSDWKPLGQVSEFLAGNGSASPVPMPVPKAMGNVPIAQPQAYSGNYQKQVIPNYLWQSIVVTLFCCMPFGVVGIIYASKVDGLQAWGDIAGANAASRSARTWAIAGAASFVVMVGGYFAVLAIIAVAASV
ncbi:MAG: CD225/dispanin family protein [Armatimonadetes bacterium]|nr:CD225/dispanin family protein [Akkermansiaceae bacterium]